jgi:DNA-binding MarR family transcriptional regulator
MDQFAIATDLISLLSLAAATLVAWKTVLAFRQSKQAVVESASLVSVIVEALTSRIQRSESLLAVLRSDLAAEARRGDKLESEQTTLHGSYEELLRQVQDMLSTDRRMVSELEQLKPKLAEVQQRRQTVEGLPRPENLRTRISEGDVLASLTPTERLTLQILNVEGPKGAPELGKRLEKSREHTSRLMKKLYMEGYVNRESNHAPFRYRLNESVRSALESGNNSLIEKQQETP